MKHSSLILDILKFMYLKFHRKNQTRTISLNVLFQVFLKMDRKGSKLFVKNLVRAFNVKSSIATYHLKSKDIKTYKNNTYT